MSGEEDLICPYDDEFFCYCGEDENFTYDGDYSEDFSNSSEVSTRESNVKVELKTAIATFADLEKKTAQTARDYEEPTNLTDDFSSSSTNKEETDLDEDKDLNNSLCEDCFFEDCFISGGEEGWLEIWYNEITKPEYENTEWEYCASHSETCRYCFERVAKINSYCVKHAYDCLLMGCPIRIAEKESYCSNHRKVCAKQGCNNRISDGIYSSRFCSEHREYSCSANNCYQTVKVRDGYCSNHSQYCQNSSSCYNRVAYNQTYCNSCQQQKSEQTKLKSLVKANTSIASVIKEVERFSTDWNKNLATVIASDGNYWVFLLVLDSENNSVKVFPVEPNASKWGEYSRSQHRNLSAAQGEANWLQNKLKYDSNPILVIHPRCDSYTSFNDLVGEPYVIKKEIGNSYSTHNFFYVRSNLSTPSNLDSCFKPLDIIWVEKRDSFIGKNYYHVGVYVGNDEIIHLSADNQGVGKVSWSTFLAGRTGELFRYRPIIPFKNYKTIIGEAVWAKDNNFRRGQYCLANRNCEHFTNMAVLGINFSKQVDEKPTLARVGCKFSGSNCFSNGGCGNFQSNNGKGSTFRLINEINESNSKLGSKSDYETKDLEERYEAQIAAPIKTGDCIIM